MTARAWVRAFRRAVLGGARPRGRVALPPLDPDRYLAWIWRRSGWAPPAPTVEDVWFELAARAPGASREEVRAIYRRLSARARCAARLGEAP